MATSGTARFLQTGDAGRNNFWNASAASTVLHPPPEPFHAVSVNPAASPPPAATVSCVPPTAITLGDDDGHSTPAPLSPDDARKVTPVSRNALSLKVWPRDSLPPQLIDTT